MRQKRWFIRAFYAIAEKIVYKKEKPPMTKARIELQADICMGIAIMLFVLGVPLIIYAVVSLFVESIAYTLPAFFGAGAAIALIPLAFWLLMPAERLKTARINKQLADAGLAAEQLTGPKYIPLLSNVAFLLFFIIAFAFSTELIVPCLAFGIPLSVIIAVYYCYHLRLRRKAKRKLSETEPT